MSNAVTLTYGQLLVLAIVPALIGGLIAIASGFVGPHFLEKQRQAAEKKKRRADKFEELIACLHEHRHWVGTLKNIILFDGGGQRTLSPFAKMQALSFVHFPTFEQALLKLDNAADEYEIVLLDAWQKKHEKDPKYADGVTDAYKPYSQRLYALLADLRAYAEREFQ